MSVARPLVGRRIQNRLYFHRHVESTDPQGVELQVGSHDELASRDPSLRWIHHFAVTDYALASLMIAQQFLR